jgi:hypothetical protein
MGALMDELQFIREEYFKIIDIIGKCNYRLIIISIGSSQV